MNFDEFEEKLRRQPRRQIPAEWREEILGPLRTNETGAPLPRWRWLWPHPVAWGALAAAWVAIFALAYAGRPEQPIASARSLAPDMLHAFEERTRLMAELSGDIMETRPSPADRPRSARRVLQVVV